jgi:hypothetical protein
MLITITILNLLPAEHVLTQATHILELRYFTNSIYQDKGNNSQLPDKSKVQVMIFSGKLNKH